MKFPVKKLEGIALDFVYHLVGGKIKSGTKPDGYLRAYQAGDLRLVQEQWDAMGAMLSTMIQDGYEIRKRSFGEGFQVIKVEGNDVFFGMGKTLPEAALRAYINEQVGDTVEVPEILINNQPNDRKGVKP